MNKSIHAIAMTIFLAALLALPINAQQHQHAGDGHGNMQDHGGHSGKLIQESTVDGFKLAYHLIDMREAMAKMEGHEGHAEKSATHHLMLYINDPGGNPVPDAVVGFLIEGPNETDQKVMAMGMGGGYGADIYLGDKGEYTIKAKAVAGDETLIDGFGYSMP